MGDLVDQTIINWLLTVFGALIGFLLNAVWQAVKDLQTADKSLADKVSGIYGAYTGISINGVGNHNHNVTGTTSQSGSSATNANMPPYYALAYIMKG